MTMATFSSWNSIKKAVTLLSRFDKICVTQLTQKVTQNLEFESFYAFIW
jgi:hypothetical protein